MTRDELLTLLRGMMDQGDHSAADDALVAYINDPEIAEAYHDIPKWFE